MRGFGNKMRISERIYNTIEGWIIAWRDRLRGWMASWVEKGVEVTFDFFEPGVRDEVKTSMNRLKEIPGLPADYYDILDRAIAEPGALHFLALLPYLIGMLIGLGMGAISPVARVGSYQIDNLIHSARLDPSSIITAWRRDPIKYEALFGDLKDLGWSDDRIEALKFYTLFLPTADEQTMWLAKEVYEPEMIAKYGLDDEMPVYEQTDFSKVGVNPEQMRNKWRAHWIHASWMEVVEMLHRGLITEEDVWRWFRVVEIPPYWRQLLIETAYTWPTRVDVRRWWDMRTIDETRLRKLYEGMGYRGENLEDYIKWTKVYTDFPMMIARFTKGWITEEEVYNWLITQGIPEERAKYFIEEKVKPEQPERVVKERDLTKAELIKGIKKGVISDVEGSELLQDMGYSADEAWFMIEINVAAAAGSPETYPEFKEITQLYRKAMGLKAAVPPKDLIEASKALREAEKALKEAEAKGLKNEKLAPYLKAVSDAAYRYRQLLAKWEEEKKKLS